MTAAVRNISTLRSGTGATVTIPMPIGVAGDHVYALLGAYSTFATTTAPCADFTIPDGWQIDDRGNVPITESATVVGRFTVIHRVVPAEGLGADIEIPSPLSATSGMWMAVAGAIKDVGGSPGFDSVVSVALQTNDPPTPAVPVHSSDSRVVFALAAFGQIEPSPTIAAPYVGPLRQVTTLHYWGEVSVWMTGSVSSDVPSVATSMPAPVLVGPGTVGWYATAAIELLPKDLPPAIIPTARARRLRLGCADDYKVFITEGDYSTVVDGVGWTDIEWTRTLDEPSTATATIPDRLGGLFCVAHLGGLKPWRYGLLIERDDQAVWSGPVTQIQRQAGGLRISASDVLARFQKRLVIRSGTITFDNADAGVALATIILSAQIAGERWALQPPVVNVGAAYSRTLNAFEFEIAWDLMSDLADSAVDFWVGNGVLYVYEPGTGWMYWDGVANTLLPGPYDASSELHYGTFTESNWTELPTWSVNGWSQANFAWVPGPEVGETGAIRFWGAHDNLAIADDGVLDHVETAPAFSSEEDEDIPDEVMQRFADSLIAQRSVSPAVMEGGALAENAPVDMDNLRPGSIWTVDIFDAGYGQLLQTTRLKAVNVRVTRNADGKVNEQIAPTLYPLGYEVT